ncbi:glycoside hydrolase family 28 protein [Mucilaginibacter limnophilus]|nr:glycosyl hydrolase family 28-related protein [Mucilaginibacter limnophilus]
MKKVLKLILVLLAVIGLSTEVHALAVESKVYNVKDYGAVGDGKTLNTDALNKAVTACADAGGGMVLVPQGNYLSGTVVLKSNVTFYLEEDATIIGTTELSQYKSLPLKLNNPKEPVMLRWENIDRWTRALILLDHVENVTIAGSGTIDGASVTDPRGEEGRRGPHAIIMGNSKNIIIKDIRVTRAGNYNIMGFYIEDAKFSRLSIIEGSDGIHIRSGKNLLIEGCKFYTRDDAIAGGYWTNMLINDCLLNTSCNGLRLIMPANGLEVKNCIISGPGVFGHYRQNSFNPVSTNTLAAFILQPGAWGGAPGRLDNVYIHDIRVRDLNTLFSFVLNENNNSRNIRVERVNATGINMAACAVEAWPTDNWFEKVSFKDINITYNIKDAAILNTAEINRPRTEARPLPYWGWYARNVKQLELTNITLNYTGNEKRPVAAFENVGSVIMNNIKYKAVKGIKPFVYKSSTKVQQTKVVAF